MFQVALIEFSASNFKSFREKFTFSFLWRKDAKDGTVFPVYQKPEHKKTDSYWLYPFHSSFIYGGNASGKSSIFEAIEFMDRKINKSHSNEYLEILTVTPFLFDEISRDKASFFEIVFSTKKNIYRYNFETKKASIVSESLSIIQTANEKALLKRVWNKIDLYNGLDYDTAHDIADKKTWTNTLFVSSMKEWTQDEIINDVLSFFNEHLSSITMLNNGKGGYTSKQIMKSAILKKSVIDYLQKADFSIQDIFIEDTEPSVDLIEKFPELKGAKWYKTEFAHPIFSDGKKTGEELLLISKESDGTQAFYKLLWPIINTLEEGWILLIDEFNSSLHHLLCKFIIDLFHNKETNPNNSQIIVTLHDITFLSDSDYDRDQFWFTERDKYGVSTLFSLAEFKNENRKNQDFGKRYLNGRYGWIPFIQN